VKSPTTPVPLNRKFPYFQKFRRGGVTLRKLVLFIHTSLDSFVAGPKGEIDWIHVDEEIFDYASDRTKASDTALYGRVTYEMMQNYWPTAGAQPNATRHDIEHSKWYNNVAKVVLSRSLQGLNLPNTTIIGDVKNKVNELKHRQGKDILMFGSPRAAHALMQLDLVDEYWLFVNPLLLGQGIPLFQSVSETVGLKLDSSHVFSNGVVCLNYSGRR